MAVAVVAGLLGLLPCASASATTGTGSSWGDNVFGQLGNGSTTADSSPGGVTGLTGATAVAAGAASSMALLASGTIVDWGRNDVGQLGTGSVTGPQTCNTTSCSETPVAVAGLSGVTAIASGGSHELALLGGGTVMAWGWNINGQLGDGTFHDRSSPVAVSGLSGVKAIAAGGNNSMALLSNGTVKDWGAGGNGALGDGVDGADSPTPVTVSGLSTATAIATSQNYGGMALLADGTVQDWGLNIFGELGTGSNVGPTTCKGNNFACSLSPVPVSGLTGVTAIAAGTYFKLALLSNGTVMAWGGDTEGELGDGGQANANACKCSSTPVAVSGLGGVVAIAAGNYAAYALRSDGTVVAWGYNVQGQLGDGTNSGPELCRADKVACSTTPVAISALSGATAVAGGVGHAVALLGAPTVSISSDNAVPEPTSGSVPATFTISLSAAQATATTVHYMTVDGSATAANNDYTAVANGSATIAAGATAATVQVQIDAGSGRSTTSTKGFQVRLTSSTGPPISATGAVAPGAITVPGIAGRLTDDSGQSQAGVSVTLSGRADTGQAVTQTTVSDGRGAYQFYADPGTYTLTPAAPVHGAGNPAYDAVNCPGTPQPGACTNIALTPSANLTADFKVIALVVNSTVSTENSAQAAAGVCDVTPSAPQTTCTLPQAIDVANQLGGRVIGFGIPGGGVPVISPTQVLPALTAPTTIDATTQPGGKVELLGVAGGPQDGYGLKLFGSASGSLIKGLVIDGFQYGVILSAVRDVVVQGNFIGTDPSGTRDVQSDAPRPHYGISLEASASNTIGGTLNGQGNVISTAGNSITGIVDDSPTDRANVIQGNRIGPLGTGKQSPVGGTALNLQGSLDTIGGTAPSAGNTIVGASAAMLGGPGSVVQGNSFTQSFIEAVDGVTVGGPAAKPGDVPGNAFADSILTLDKHNVVQGNLFHNSEPAIDVEGDSNTIGGASASLGNEFRDNSGFGPVAGGIAVGFHGGDASGNVVENNVFERNLNDGAVGIYSGAGNSIFENRMLANTLPVNLGGREFRYNTLDGARPASGPNHRQPYPELLSASAHGKTNVTVTLTAPRGRYTIDLYSQPHCAQDDITPGEGEQPLGRQTINVGIVQGDAKLSFKAATGAVSATATAPDGSTSEFSPCLTIGHNAPAFKNRGVTVPGGSVNAQSAAKGAGSAALAAALPTRRTAALEATLRPFCPPVTAGLCMGTIVLRQSSSRAPFARLKFKLAPGQLGSLSFGVPSALGKRLWRVHQIKLTAAISARDNARHAHHKSTRANLVLRLARTR